MYDLFRYDGGHTKVSEHVSADDAILSIFNLPPAIYEVWDRVNYGSRIARIKTYKEVKVRFNGPRLAIFQPNRSTGAMRRGPRRRPEPPSR